jgi:hypothetical protein
LAGLSDGTLGGALKLDPQKTLSVWDELDKLLGHFGAPSALNAAIEWTTVLGSEISKLRKKDDTFPQVQATFEIIIKSLRLWWRDTAVLAVTGDRSRLLGPPPSAAQLAWAEKLTADKLAKLEDSLSRLVDGLGRAMRLEIIFENYWLDVLE